MVTRKRIEVIYGEYAGTRGWGYFAENQDEFDSVYVQLDKVELQNPRSSLPTSALGAGRKARQKRSGLVSDGFMVPTLPASGETRRYQYPIRMLRRNIQILSDLELLAEVEGELCSAPPRLPQHT